VLFDLLSDLIRGRCEGASEVVVAMSGGVDSCLVAAAAVKGCGEKVIGITVVSELTQERDAERAAVVAAELGMKHERLTASVLHIPGVRANGKDRCYHCKNAIFRLIMERHPGCVLLDGTNADDDPARPGRRAAEELGVLSPLLEAGIGKRMIRELAREQGLSNWDAPSESCLAARIRQGIPLDLEGLSKVRAMEAFFHERGVHTLRTYHDNLIATVIYLPQYAGIMEKSRDNFAELVQKIGLRSYEFEEYAE